MWRHTRTRGVLLALENTSHLAEPKLLVRILEDVASPAVRLLLDTANLLQTSGDPQTTMRGIELLAPLVVHTQLGNGRGQGEGYRPTPLAEGDLDMPAVLELLWRAGYQGRCARSTRGPMTRMSTRATSRSCAGSAPAGDGFAVAHHAAWGTLGHAAWHGRGISNTH